MSASVATPMAGLLKHDFSSENMADFTATDFPDHMELDRSDDLMDSLNHHHDSSPGVQRQSIEHTANNVATTEEQNEALGNLLGALMPKQPDPSGDAPNLNSIKDSSTLAHEHPSNNQQVQSDSQAVNGPSRLPSFDATVAQEMFPNEDFSDFDHNMNVPHTPNGQVIYDDNMAHFRQDSFASLASAARAPAMIQQQQREFEAFARLLFEDGNYYLNTYSCELGRDVLAYRAAIQKEKEEKEAELNGYGKSRSSSGRASHLSHRMRRQLGSQMQGSIVSEKGGFAGIDEAPMRPPANPEKPTMSSQESESSVVKPAEYLINPRTMPFDYHKSTEMQARWTAKEDNDEEIADDEEPVAVTAAHLPNPQLCPLIPIHGKPKEGQTDAELHKKISRRHVKIQWSFGADRWEMKVQGRNGAFCDDRFVSEGDVVPLHDRAKIQIAHVVLTFLLPKTLQQLQEGQQSSVDLDEILPSIEAQQADSVADEERRQSITDPKVTPKINLKITQKVDPSPPELPLGPDGLPIVKRRGPGRPPKDGIMSTRERKEREKAAKLALAREANGGRTPPPQMRGKLPKTSPPVIEDVKIEVKQPEKRKYTKRKGPDENGNSLLDGPEEGDEVEAGSDEEPKSKKARAQREKSESPEYPPRESLTAEQLARPPENYQNLLYKILMDLYPRALPLKDIYREMKRRYPWYVYEAQTEGWQSSVRHNLNSEYKKLFDKGDKEGKGFAWRAIPNAQLPQTDKKRTTPAQVQRPRPNPPRPQFQQIPGQNIQWQGTGTFAAGDGQQPFINHGPWPQGQSNANWPQNGVTSAGHPPQTSPSASHVQQPLVPNMQQPTPQAPRNTTGTGQAPSIGVVQSVNAPPPPPPAPGARSLPSIMPSLIEGIEAIARFELAMCDQLRIKDMMPEKRDFWLGVFASAKKRVLHGHVVSTHPKGDSREEATIMAHMQNFVDRFPNPNFTGFRARTSQPDTSVGTSQIQASLSTQESAASAGLDDDTELTENHDHGGTENAEASTMPANGPAITQADAGIAQPSTPAPAANPTDNNASDEALTQANRQETLADNSDH